MSMKGYHQPPLLALHVPEGDLIFILRRFKVVYFGNMMPQPLNFTTIKVVLEVATHK